MLRQLRRANVQRLWSLQWACGALEATAGTASQGAIASSCSPVGPAQAGPVAAAAWHSQIAHYSKKAKKGAGAAAADAGQADAGAAGFNLSETKQLMERAVAHLQGELSNIRTGRATPGMLDHLKVDVYGDRLPLKACGSVSVRDPQLLVITVFDTDAVPSVVKAVSESPLRLSPRAEGQEVLVPIPRPTAETLAVMGKVCKEVGEAAKVTVRHARKLAMDAARKLASEDERKRVEKEVQKLTDDWVKEVEGLVAKKEASIRSHDS